MLPFLLCPFGRTLYDGQVSFSSPEATPRLAHPGMGGVEEPYEEGALWKGPLEEDETTETESTEEGTSLSPLERRASGRVQKVLLQVTEESTSRPYTLCSWLHIHTHRFL